MSTNPTTVPSPPVLPRHELYVPGYALPKLGMALLGLVILGSSLEKLGPLAMLAATGGSTRAEAVRIIRTDAAGQETIYTTDAEVLTATKSVEESRDRESVFWLEYRFTTADMQAVETRAPFGQMVKPLQPLRDSDGLPSTIKVWYDVSNPKYIALPGLFGTWFMPGMLALFGGMGTFMGFMLLWYAKKPIEMPDLSRSHGEQDAGKAKA
ncbi:MAG: DUF3592 domain-containing protein [Phycisphaerae bacterium]